MPAKVTHPGVHVEEVSASLRAITPVSTATAAFIGYTRRGPLNRPVRVRGFAEFERHFGGPSRHGAVAYAAHQFFAAGGGEAVIVRVIKEGSATTAAVTLQGHVPRHDHGGGSERLGPHDVLKVRADAPGHWGNGLRVVVDYATMEPHRTFGLHVINVYDGRRESYRGLSMDPDDHRYAPAVINDSSELIRVEALGEGRPYPSGTISKSFDEELPDLDVDLEVRIGDVEREFHLYDPDCDGEPPCNMDELAALLERKLRALRDKPGSDAFRRAEVRPIGHRRLQTIAGSLDEDDVVRFHGQCADDLGLDEFENPPARALCDGDDGDPPEARDLIGDESRKTGLQALRDVDDVNLLNVPELAGWEHTEDAHLVIGAAERLARQERSFLLVDAPAAWKSVDAARTGAAGLDAIRSDHAALYFPHLVLDDPVTGRPRAFPPSASVAGVIARTDTERGVWKAPAGTAARVPGVRALTVPLTDTENGLLNPLAINCLRTFPGSGTVVWGARTLHGTDARAGERAEGWTYVPGRRLALHVAESLYRGLRWVVFEPNDERLWQAIRLDVSTYLDGLFKKGAFAGRTPREAYFVRCDAETTTPADIADGVVNVEVGIATAAPAEFVMVRIQQLAGQLGTGE